MNKFRSFLEVVFASGGFLELSDSILLKEGSALNSWKWYKATAQRNFKMRAKSYFIFQKINPIEIHFYFNLYIIN